MKYTDLEEDYFDYLVWINEETMSEEELVEYVIEKGFDEEYVNERLGGE